MGVNTGRQNCAPCPNFAANGSAKPITVGGLPPLPQDLKDSSNSQTTAAMFAPYVIVQIIGKDPVMITVGNKSIPGSAKFGHRAVIKSFQYGQSNGCGVIVEIVDEEGGVFQRFFDKMVHCLQTTNDQYKIKVQWGWVADVCSAGGHVIVQRSAVHNFVVIKVDVKFEQTLTFVLECYDLMTLSFETLHQAEYGSDHNVDKMDLKDALRKLFTQTCPKIEQIKFLTRSAGKNPRDQNPEIDMWKFEDPYKKKYLAKGQNPEDVAWEWIKSHLTERGKGVTMAWDDMEDVSTLVMWEYSEPVHKEKGPDPNSGDNIHIGNYMVNGGPCGNVISFTPSIKWTFMYASKLGGEGSTQTAKIPHEKENSKSYELKEYDCALEGQNSECSNENNTSGPRAENAPDEISQEDGKDGQEKAQKADAEHMLANRNYEPVTAEMRIHGNPVLDDPLLMKFAYASIIVINPFHIAPTKARGACGDWAASGTQGDGAVAVSTCNPTLSNKKWWVVGVSHEIRLGTYTTTLKLVLPTPGSTIHPNNTTGIPIPQG